MLEILGTGMNRSFGLILREYRNRSVDPQTGRHLSQERLAALIGETLGTSYTAQAVSDWERNKSQIHKDHRQVLKTLIQVLHTCGGLTSLEDADRLLAAGNYRSLTHTESESIFLLPDSTPSHANKAEWLAEFLHNHTQDSSTHILILKVSAIILCWLAAWMAISPILDFSNNAQGLLLKEAIILSLTGLFVPAILAWIASINATQTVSFTLRILHFLGGILGFSLGLVNILTLANLSYNFYLYPWPTVLILLISLWPVALSLTSASLLQSHFHSTTGEIRLRDIHFQWAILCLPLLIGLGRYRLYHILSARLLGPLLLITLSIVLGLLLWSQTRRMS